MVTPYGIKFSVHIITSHFGNLVAKVCEKLLTRGPLTLQLLIRFTELNSLQVKNSLLILIQHNCVQAFSAEESGGIANKQTPTQYLVLFDNILHRLRFPKFLEIVAQELDENCAELLEGLLQHGRLTQEQIYERAKSIKSGDCADQSGVQEHFRKLVNDRFIERCPAPEPFIAESTPEETPAKKRGAKATKLVEVKKTLEQRVLEEAAVMEAQRFSIMEDLETDIDAEKSKDSSSIVRLGEKRKGDLLELDGDFSFNNKEVTLWRANFEEFLRCLRHKACVESVRARLDDGAAIVLKALLKATRGAEKKVKMENSVPLSLDSIFEEVMKSEAGRTMTLDRVRASLDQLGCPSSMGIDDSYSIDLKKIIELSQNEEVESIVLNRYGRDGYRVFRLLSKAGHLLETDKISEMTFVEKKDTPKILYKLWQDEYLHMEKMVVNTKQFLLWKVNKSILCEHVLDEMYHAALNLSLRSTHEMEQHKELLNLPAGQCTGPMEKKRLWLRSVRIYLVSSLLKLDDAIMLFHDF
ncbi:hypothetical protein FNV43_RR24083 [Rhamnella rubrinervis]|uniref:DNA-directed RNA polymerase III subunit RPC3 n=1 Tax=Rhamnella rubrinervis TaxID=2594499 RepID=A0A8K0DM56_9ROSA|nr:hypothetical protein FNV43_RR24083 [Rhamnella rubrinervis]